MKTKWEKKKLLISQVTLDTEVTIQGDFDYRHVETSSGVVLMADKLHCGSHDDTDGFFEIKTVWDLCEWLDCELSDILADAWVWDYAVSGEG